MNSEQLQELIIQTLSQVQTIHKSDTFLRGWCSDESAKVQIFMHNGTGRIVIYYKPTKPANGYTIVVKCIRKLIEVEIEIPKKLEAEFVEYKSRYYTSECEHFMDVVNGTAMFTDFKLFTCITNLVERISEQYFQYFPDLDGDCFSNLKIED